MEFNWEVFWAIIAAVGAISAAYWLFWKLLIPWFCAWLTVKLSSPKNMARILGRDIRKNTDD